MPVKLTADKIPSKLGRRVDVRLLVELSLPNHQISEIGNLSKCACLERLDLRGNRIQTQTQISGLWGLSALRELDLSGNPVTRTAGYREAILAHLPALRMLDGQPVGATSESQPAPAPASLVPKPKVGSSAEPSLDDMLMAAAAPPTSTSTTSHTPSDTIFGSLVMAPARQPQQEPNLFAGLSQPKPEPPPETETEKRRDPRTGPLFADITAGSTSTATTSHTDTIFATLVMAPARQPQQEPSLPEPPPEPETERRRDPRTGPLFADITVTAKPSGDASVGVGSDGTLFAAPDSSIPHVSADFVAVLAEPIATDNVVGVESFLPIFQSDQPMEEEHVESEGRREEPEARGEAVEEERVQAVEEAQSEQSEGRREEPEAVQERSPEPIQEDDEPKPPPDGDPFSILDTDLRLALSYVPHAFQGSTLDGRFLFKVVQGGIPLVDATVTVSPSGASVVPGQDGTPDCTVVAERDALVLILQGSLDAPTAMMCGQILVDDLNQLMVFAAAFRFERAAFAEYVAGKEEKEEEEEKHAEDPLLVHALLFLLFEWQHCEHAFRARLVVPDDSMPDVVIKVTPEEVEFLPDEADDVQFEDDEEDEEEALEFIGTLNVHKSDLVGWMHGETSLAQLVVMENVVLESSDVDSFVAMFEAAFDLSVAAFDRYCVANPIPTDHAPHPVHTVKAGPEIEEEEEEEEESAPPPPLQQLQEAFQFLPYCYLGSAFCGALRFRVAVADDGDVVKVVTITDDDAVTVTETCPDGVLVTATVDVDLPDFVGMVHGTLGVRPAALIASGRVRVDNIAGLLAFKSAFAFSKPRFTAFVRALREEGAGDLEAAEAALAALPPPQKGTKGSAARRRIEVALANMLTRQPRRRRMRVKSEGMDELVELPPMDDTGRPRLESNPYEAIHDLDGAGSPFEWPQQ